MEFYGIQVRQISQELLKVSITIMYEKCDGLM